MERNIAVAGCGAWGKNLVRNFAQLGALHTICDTDPKALENLKSQYSSVNTSADFQQVLGNEKIRGVVIATPPVLHYRMAKDALTAARDVFVEKPLCLKRGEARELVEIAAERARILMVGHILEYHPAIAKLKELTERGVLGELQYIYSNRLTLSKSRSGQHVLWDLAPHDLSLILLLLGGKMPQEISAHGGSHINQNTADVALVTMSFENGVKAHIFNSWLHPYKEQKLVVVGDEKMAVFDDTNPEDKLQLYSCKTEGIKGRPLPQLKGMEVVTVPLEEPLKIECQDFLQCIATRQKPRADGVKGLQIVDILSCCQKSLEKKGEIITFAGLTKQS